MDVLFAPDWRQGVPYQRLLAEALTEAGVEVRFLSHYKRILPLWRLVRSQPPDLLHLHWPEAYYPQKQDRWDSFRRARFILDLALTARKTPFVFTAHNLAEHNHQHAFAKANYAAAYKRASLVFAHSQTAADELMRLHGLAAKKIRVIPHGDLSVVMPPPMPMREARKLLELPAGPICIMFGAVEAYKGQEEVIAYWRKARPAATLLIAGKPQSPAYEDVIRNATKDLPNVILHLRWLGDQDLSHFLSAADVALFNYRTIFTSGAAALARSWGLPLLIPARLNTVDLAEPNSRVFRFQDLDTDFAEKLKAAFSIAPGYAAAAPWRAQTAWSRVAELTATGYRDVLGLT